MDACTAFLGIGSASSGRISTNRWRARQGYDRSPDLTQKPAEFLGKLLDFRPSGEFPISFDDLVTYQERYGVSTAHRPRTERLYQPPLVIMPQSPGDDDTAPRAYLSDGPLAFSQSYYGYSCDGHPEAETLASLLYLLPHSKLFAYFCLMISRRGGFDRQTFNKEEFDALPFPDLDKMTAASKAALRDLAYRLRHDPRKPWDEINNFIFRLYGFDSDEVQVAIDTLFATASYRKAGRAALDFTDRTARVDFLDALREELKPYFDVCGEHAFVRKRSSSQTPGASPGSFLRFRARKRRYRSIQTCCVTRWTWPIATAAVGSSSMPPTIAAYCSGCSTGDGGGPSRELDCAPNTSYGIISTLLASRRVYEPSSPSGFFHARDIERAI